MLLRAAAVPVAVEREGVTLLRVVRLPEEARVVVPLPAERAVEAEEALEERTVPLLLAELERAGVPPMLNEDPDAERVVLPEELERAVLPDEPDRTGDCDDTEGELDRLVLPEL